MKIIKFTGDQGKEYLEALKTELATVQLDAVLKVEKLTPLELRTVAEIAREVACRFEERRIAAARVPRKGKAEKPHA